jgi:hypothetical protein
MSRLFDLRVITAAQLYSVDVSSTSRTVCARAAAYALGELEVAGYKAVSIDPRSDYQGVIAYFDGDQQGVPVLPGNFIIERFRQLAITPAHPWVHTPQNVQIHNVDKGVLVQPGLLMLRLWREVPDELPPLPQMRTHAVTQALLAASDDTFEDDGVLLAEIAGAKWVTFWATNKNATNDATTTLQLYPVRAEVPPNTPPLQACCAAASLASIVVPTTADGNMAVFATVTNPGWNNVGIFAASTLTMGQSVQFQCGIIFGRE